MAQLEQDREDLMREATALVRRMEVQLPGHAQTCVVGVRRGGEVSVFVGANPVFQFNAAGELRRGFWNGRLVKSEGGRLVQLERRRTDAEVQLVRHELTDSQTVELLRLAEETLNLLRRVLDSGEIVIVKQVPAEMDAVPELAEWLKSIPQPLEIALAPNVS